MTRAGLGIRLFLVPARCCHDDLLPRALERLRSHEDRYIALVEQTLQNLRQHLHLVLTKCDPLHAGSFARSARTAASFASSSFRSATVRSGLRGRGDPKVTSP